MNEQLTGIRNAVRALIVEDDRVLLLRKRNADVDDYYALPGGAQELGESLVDALQRECREEIGSTVHVGDLLTVADFTRQRRSQPPGRRQLVEFLFLCKVPDGYRPHNGPMPDRHQRDVVWIERRHVASLRLAPDFLQRIVSSPARGGPAYAGACSDRADTP
jgi:ADP-ribose pyrophosphatase YjhB (NUDIX family)